jgi:iron(III) transport system substrate-binding protein
MRPLLRLLAVLVASTAACGAPAPGEVVVYTSVDEIYALEVFAAFTRETGIRVRPVFDTEEAKTLGLVHRLLAERGDPQADVFWNGECARTALLTERGVLDPYRAPTAEGIGPEWRDPGDAWVGFGARARVIVYNTRLVERPPRGIEELAVPEWRGRAAMANPLFGTTAAHVAALAQHLGEERTLRLLESLRSNGLRLVGGYSHVRDLVARGDCAAGLTDTDDVWIGKLRGDPIEMVFPDQEGIGTLAVPNTAALVRGAPHGSEARRLLDFLLRPETEAMLAAGRSRQMPVRAGVPVPEGLVTLDRLRTMRVDWARIASSEAFLERARESLGL